jgi:Rod binding domain-containing protein
MDIQSSVSIMMAAGTVKPTAPQQVQGSESGETFHQALAQASSETAKVADAAKQFEALIAGQVLKAAREASDGWLGSDGDQTGELALEMAEQGFAQALAARGGLGVSKSVIGNLYRGQSNVLSRMPLANSRGSDALVLSRAREEAVIKSEAGRHTTAANSEPAAAR